MTSSGSSIAAIAICFATTFDEHAQEATTTPEQELEQLLAEYREAPSHGPLSDAERTQYVGRVYKHHFEVSLRLVDFAERHPKSPLALRALIQAAWQVNSNPWPVELVGEDAASGRALTILARDHVDRAELGPLCRRIGYGLRREYEPFLRAVLADSPHPPAQGIACLALAHYLNQRLQRLDLLELQPESRKEFGELFGAEYLETLRKCDRSAARREIESLLERAGREFGDVAIPDEGTVGEQAAAELFELRHLCVGATAPEIEGEDQHGVRFKLSDYRGKVVLIDFWSWV